MSSLMDGLDDGGEEKKEIKKESHGDAEMISTPPKTKLPPKEKEIEIRSESQSDAQVIPPKKSDSGKKIKQLENQISDLKTMIAEIHRQFADHMQQSQITPTIQTETSEITEEIINNFIKFMKQLKPSDHPVQAQIIRQMQKYGKTQIIANILQLYKIFEVNRK